MSISSDHRTALSAALGIIISFALGFAGQWAVAEGVWQAWHLVPGALLLVGVSILIYALQRALLLPSDDDRAYRRIVHRFSLGVVLTFLGFMSTVFIEAGRQWFVGPPEREVRAEFVRRRPGSKITDLIRVPKRATTVVLYVDADGKIRADELSFVKTETGWAAPH